MFGTGKMFGSWSWKGQYHELAKAYEILTEHAKAQAEIISDTQHALALERRGKRGPGYAYPELHEAEDILIKVEKMIEASGDRYNPLLGLDILDVIREYKEIDESI